ncbi:MAG: ABC transporter permease, partial [Culicoidibacterales bacterium]
VKIPLAFPIILAGVRTAMILSISAVTLGAAAGSGGLGVPIILGLRSQNLVLILQGTIPIALMALIVDQSLRMWEQRVNRN